MKSFLLKLPKGRVALTYDPGTALRATMPFHTNLKAQVFRNGKVLKQKEYRKMNIISRLLFGNRTTFDMGSGVVVHAGVRLLSQDTAVSAGAACLNVMKNHGVGTGTNSETSTDTALQTAIGTTATAGSNANADASPNATVTSTATVSPGAAAVTEWGLFNQTTLSGATMFDRRKFSAINTGASDSIAFTYTLTLSSGG